MEGSAMPTTVASRKAMPEPSTVAVRTQRPRAERSARETEGSAPPDDVTADRCAW